MTKNVNSTIEDGPKRFYVTLESEDKAARETVDNIIERAFRVFENAGNVTIPRVYFGSSWSDGDFGSMKWYIKESLVPQRNQASIEKLFELLRTEPWQKSERHYELSVLETDVFAEGTNFVFGGTKAAIYNNGWIWPYPADTANPPVNIYGTIISLDRIKEWYVGDWELALSTLLIHELGHFYGLTDVKNPKADFKDSRSLNYGHCDDRFCVMEQMNVSGKLSLIEKAKLIDRNDPFCESDRFALVRNLSNMYRR